MKKLFLITGALVSLSAFGHIAKTNGGFLTPIAQTSPRTAPITPVEMSGDFLTIADSGNEDAQKNRQSFNGGLFLAQQDIPCEKIEVELAGDTFTFCREHYNQEFGLSVKASFPSPSGESCKRNIEDFKRKHPPVAYVGDPSEYNYPNQILMNKKLERTFALWTIPQNPGRYNCICIEEVRHTCWEYCAAGIGPGNLDLYCITKACMHYTESGFDQPEPFSALCSAL